MLFDFLSGKINVLVGTSAVLFQEDILSFCGLFIIDEEHRFGVKDKELIFKQKPNQPEARTTTFYRYIVYLLPGVYITNIRILYFFSHQSQFLSHLSYIFIITHVFGLYPFLLDFYGFPGF